MVNDKKNAEREFSLIKEGLKLNKARIAEFLKQRVGQGDWKLTETDVPVNCEGEQETIDMVYSCETGKNGKVSYILVDISVPHLGIGQQYTLPTKGKAFQTERDVPSNRLKKAIILIRRGIDGVKALPARIRCPIIDVQLENIVAKRSETKSQNKQENKQTSEQNERKNENASKENVAVKEKEANYEALTSDMLFALKEAVVHDYISTSYKRSNKYVCRGLWKWVEKEIMDPNVHFFFIILSSIYQGKTGDILSKKFRTLDALMENPEDVYNTIFSKENPLVDDIKRDTERHKKAIMKLLLCFSQTSPFEYLKSMFLKEFRTNADSIKARMSVYNTLQQLLERCGFEGEREIAYPLEILDELKIFREILTGDYSKLRIDNAYKKLKHLIPQIEWNSDDIYKLRRELAKSFSIPENEFNLNAYLPQAFYQDAKIMAEQKRENIRGNSDRNEKASVKQEVIKEPVKGPEQILEEIENAQRGEERVIKKTSKKVPPVNYDENEEEQQNDVPQKKVVKQISSDYEMPPKKRRKGDEVESAYEAAMQAERMAPVNGIPQEESENEVDEAEYDETEVIDEEENENVDESVEVEEDEETESEDDESESDETEPDDEEQAQERMAERRAREFESNEYYEYDLFGNPIKVYRRGDCDESRHRNFESFGGVMVDDIDSMKMAIAMTNYEIERLARAARAPKISEEEKEAMELEAEDEFMPIKKAPARVGVANRPNFRSDNNRRFSGEAEARPQRRIPSDDRNNGGRRTYSRENKYNNQSKRYYSNNNRRGYSSGSNRQNNRRGR